MIIFLIGFMGSGKTTLGKQLATKLDYRFIDQDEIIETRFGLTVTEIFAQYGEDKFRESENHILSEIIKGDNCIVATGGGAPCFLNNMQLMNENGFTIYLKVDPEILVDRLKNSHNTRPLVKDKTQEQMLEYTKHKLAERAPFYNQAKLVLYSKNILVEDIQNGLADMGLNFG